MDDINLKLWKVVLMVTVFILKLFNKEMNIYKCLEFDKRNIQKKKTKAKSSVTLFHKFFGNELSLSAK